MIQSLASINSAMISLNQMQTVRSTQVQLEGRSRVLEAEIKSGAGNTEAKEKDLAENEEKVANATENLNNMIAETTEELNKPMTQEELQELHEQREAEKAQSTGKKEDSTGKPGSVQEPSQQNPGSVDTVTIDGAHPAVLPQAAVAQPVGGVVGYDAAGIAVSAVAAAKPTLEVLA